MRYLKEGMEARRVDVFDYDRLCELVRWCQGKAVDHGDKVIRVPVKCGGVAYVKHGDWIIRGIRANVCVVNEAAEWHPVTSPWPNLSDQP